MQGGKLRHRVTFQRLTQVTNPFAATSTWEDQFSCNARIEPISSRETFQDQKLSMRVSHRVTIRYPGSMGTVQAGDQIMYGTRTFQVVQSVLDQDERQIELVILAWENNPIQ